MLHVSSRWRSNKKYNHYFTTCVGTLRFVRSASFLTVVGLKPQGLSLPGCGPRGPVSTAAVQRGREVPPPCKRPARGQQPQIWCQRFLRNTVSAGRQSSPSHLISSKGTSRLPLSVPPSSTAFRRPHSPRPFLTAPSEAFLRGRENAAGACGLSG